MIISVVIFWLGIQGGGCWQWWYSWGIWHRISSGINYLCFTWFSLSFSAFFLGFVVWCLVIPFFAHITFLWLVGSQSFMRRLPIVSYYVPIFGLRIFFLGASSLIWSFGLFIWYFLPLLLSLPLVLLYCDWYPVHFWFLGSLFADLESLLIPHLGFSSTVMRGGICTCYGDI